MYFLLIGHLFDQFFLSGIHFFFRFVIHTELTFPITVIDFWYMRFVALIYHAYFLLLQEEPKWFRYFLPTSEICGTVQIEILRFYLFIIFELHEFLQFRFSIFGSLNENRKTASQWSALVYSKCYIHWTVQVDCFSCLSRKSRLYYIYKYSIFT